MTNKKTLPEEEVYEEDILELIDEDGNSEKFYPLDLVEYKGATYGIFQLAEPETEEDDGCFVFSMEEDGEDAVFNEVEDDELAEAVFQLYLQRLKEAEEE